MVELENLLLMFALILRIETDFFLNLLHWSNQTEQFIVCQGLNDKTPQICLTDFYSEM